MIEVFKGCRTRKKWRLGLIERQNDRMHTHRVIKTNRSSGPETMNKSSILVSLESSKRIRKEINQ